MDLALQSVSYVRMAVSANGRLELFDKDGESLGLVTITLRDSDRVLCIQNAMLKDVRVYYITRIEWAEFSVGDGAWCPGDDALAQSRAI